jgi:hypothetical protein
MGDVIQPIGSKDTAEAAEKARLWAEQAEAQTKTSGVQAGKGKTKVQGKEGTAAQVGDVIVHSTGTSAQGIANEPSDPSLPASSLVSSEGENNAAKFMANPGMITVYLTLSEISQLTAKQNIIMSQYENKVSKAVADNVATACVMMEQAGRAQADTLRQSAIASGAAATTAIVGCVGAGLSIAGTVAGEIAANKAEKALTDQQQPKAAAGPEVKIEPAKLSPAETAAQASAKVSARAEERQIYGALGQAGTGMSQGAQAAGSFVTAATQGTQAKLAEDQARAQSAQKIAEESEKVLEKAKETVKKVDQGSSEALKDLQNLYQTLTKPPSSTS